MPKDKTDKNFSQDLAKILDKTIKNKVYGSVEIFFEAGNITQITQRIIRKIPKTKPADSKEIAQPKKTVANHTKINDEESAGTAVQ